MTAPTAAATKEAVRALRPPRRRARRTAPPGTRDGPPTSAGGGGGARRGAFSTLLLEHGERDLRADWAVVATATPLPEGNDAGGNAGARADAARPWRAEGRLRLCSRSLVFEPRRGAVSRGIVRAPFRHMAARPFVDVGGGHGAAAVAVARCARHVVMNADGAIGPHADVRRATEFRFEFAHSSPADLVARARRLFDAEAQAAAPSTASAGLLDSPAAVPAVPAPAPDRGGGGAAAGARPFDAARFLRASERQLTPSLRCAVRTPLAEERGRAVLTEHGLYYQPDAGGEDDVGNSGAGSEGAAECWPLAAVRAVARRYDGVRERGLEVYPAGRRSVLLTFDSRDAREHVLRLLTEGVARATAGAPPPCVTDRAFVESALALWRAGELDNFDYLLCLNAAAGRSFHDLSRYPVFPWVLASYGGGGAEDGGPDLTDPATFRDLAKPVGALNEERFADFDRRHKGMVEQQQKGAAAGGRDAPFLYGTHYSAPGYVLYYLLRVMPEHMLLLQNGKFDVPDRLFHSVEATHESVLTNPADVKELIPEFYDPDCVDFLLNSLRLRLGNMQSRRRVDDVVLPAWAQGSARTFLRRHRAALESDRCTERLPRWIDLVFGAAARGPGAREARNLFHPLSYLGPEDLDAIRDPADRAAAELQASEFGLVPDQLFGAPHPGRDGGAGGEGAGAATLLTRERSRGRGDAVPLAPPDRTEGWQGSAPPGSSFDEGRGELAAGRMVSTNPFD